MRTPFLVYRGLSCLLLVSSQGQEERRREGDGEREREREKGSKLSPVSCYKGSGPILEAAAP